MQNDGFLKNLTWLTASSRIFWWKRRKKVGVVLFLKIWIILTTSWKFFTKLLKSQN